MKRITALVFFICQSFIISALANAPTPHLATPNMPATANAVTLQQLSEQLAKTEQQNAFYEAKIEQLQNKASDLQQQLDTANSSVWTFSLPDFQPLENVLLANKVVSIIVGTTAILIALLWLPWNKRAPKERAEPVIKLVETDPDLKDEYDYMNTDEAIPAKLDLARAYMDMEEFSSAAEVLQEVMHKGDDQQKEQAKILLATLPVIQT